PSARPASTYWFCATEIVALRTMRDAPAEPSTPRARTTLNRPGPSTAMMDRITTRKGNDYHASTTRCTTMSYVPPKEPLVTPISVASTFDSSTAPKPTVIETRAPYTTRLKTSRARLSVPIQDARLGGLRLAPAIVSP